MAHQKQHLASDPPHAGGSLSAVRARVHKYAPRAPRHRPTIADASKPICRFCLSLEAG